MARINVEDSLYTDPRFMAVERKLPRFIAKGAFLDIARLAQKYWANGKRPIPKNVWALGEYPKEFIECLLVEEREDGFYLVGSEDNFAWIVAQTENGKKGGRPRENSNLTKPNDNPTKPTANPPTPTPTPTPTLNLTLSTKVKAPRKRNHPKIWDDGLTDREKQICLGLVEYWNERVDDWREIVKHEYPHEKNRLAKVMSITPEITSLILTASNHLVLLNKCTEENLSDAWFDIITQIPENKYRLKWIEFKTLLRKTPQKYLQLLDEYNQCLQ